MACFLKPKLVRDHCRIGSLEIARVKLLLLVHDHCRIGSLENHASLDEIVEKDHCRIGSLENSMHCNGYNDYRSLPHRQLRNHRDEKRNLSI